MNKLGMTLRSRWGGAAILALFSVQAHAVGTLADTDVSNTATVNYEVGGVAPAPVNSNTITFKVDRRIDLTVAEVGNAYTSTSPNQTGQVLTYTVTNSGNAAADYRLIATNAATNAADPFGGTDDFDPSNLQVFVDANGNGTYDPGTDTATFIDELPADGTITVFVSGDIPAGPNSNDSAAVILTAIAAESGNPGSLGADSTETTGADNAGTVDTVFGDSAGDADASRDGRHSDADAYLIQAGAIRVTKTSRVISDPFNGTANPKRIPGATLQYCVVVENTGASDATNVNVSDLLDGQPVTYVPGSIRTGASACDATDGVSEDDNATGTDENNPDGGSFAGNQANGLFPTVGAGSTVRLQFNVTIN